MDTQLTDASADDWGFDLETDLISVYTRGQAIEDGTLCTLSQQEDAELNRLSAQHFPGVDAACTSSVFELVRQAVEHPRWSNDYVGVFHDVFWMSRRKNSFGQFSVMITGTGRKKWHVLKVVESDEPLTVADMKAGKTTRCLTFMLPEED